jgi:hypothetical protein
VAVLAKECIGAVQSAGLDAQSHLASARLFQRDFLDLQNFGPTVFIKHSCFRHVVISLSLRIGGAYYSRLLEPSSESV